MLILSKYKDFYDGVANSKGIDKTIRYQRDILYIEEKDLPKPFEIDLFLSYSKSENILRKVHRIFIYNRINKNWFSYFIIGFCGKLYLGFRIYYYNKKTNKHDRSEITYDIDELINEIKSLKKHEKDLIELRNEVNRINAIDLFHQHKTPVWCLDLNFSEDNDYSLLSGKNIKLVINPELKEYKFFKVIDSYTAFQEIEMFIGGVLGNNENKIIEISDKDKLIKHGFDKFSFKKEPEKNN